MAHPVEISSLGPVAVLGFGRFGRAFAELLARAGLGVRAWDPQVPVPPPGGAAGLSDLVAGASIVVVATPIGAIRPALEDLLPLLQPTQTVIDVGSVKVRPANEMGEVLGTTIPWAATHPLFGPVNIARGDHVLRAVVCPNDMHPKAVTTARRLYEAIGCDVIEQAADEHDRVMARTHAMAFFIAKGLIDIDAGEDLPFSPPSFQALAQVIDTVRSDAGHLFLAIQRDNPEAAPARKALLDALSHAHDQIGLAASGAADAPGPEELRIPEPEATIPELMETRDLIDELDREIVRLLGRRANLAARAGTIKARDHRPVRDPGRELDLLEERRRWAAESGLPAAAVADVFEAILRLSRDAQS